MKYPLVALSGFARTGKDEIGKVFIEAGYHRVCFGDVIKRQVDSLVQKHLGFSAFTENDSEKKQIRRTLQYWGEDNYDNIFKEFFDTLPSPAVNTRLCRVREAEEWVRRGGIIVNVTRPGASAETDWSKEVNETLRNSGLIHSGICNDGTVEELQAKVIDLFLK